MSTHRIDIIRIPKPEIHPNADTLSIIKLLGGYTVVIRTADWQEGQLAAYIEPDYEVPTGRKEFAFLAREGRTHHRVAVKKLRGIYSQGLLIPAPEGATEGDNVIEHLGIRRYEPQIPEEKTAGQSAKPPAGWRPVYDVENWRRYSHLFVDGEEIYISEKADGSSWRGVWLDGELHVGSRTEWKRQAEHIVFWKATRDNPWIVEWLMANPGMTLYGEVFGNMGRIKYVQPGHKLGEKVYFRAFDILEGNRWLDYADFERLIPAEGRVPLIYKGPYSAATLEGLVEGDSALGGKIREGIVIRPVIERTSPEIGRVQLKVVSNRYLEKEF